MMKIFTVTPPEYQHYDPWHAARYLPRVLTLAAGVGLAASPALAQQTTPCQRTASNMFQACELDVDEEFNTTLANCENIGDNAEQAQCRDNAQTARTEEKELCEEQRAWRLAACSLLGEFRYDPDPLLDPDNAFVDPNEIPDETEPNPYLSLEAGLVSVLRAGEDGEEVVVILNTDETREIQDVECRIVAEVAVEEAEEEDEEEEEENEDSEYEYTPLEVTFDFFAQVNGEGAGGQNNAGDIIYCGENTVEYEEGFPVSTDGTFIAGVDFAKAGTLLRANPNVGDADRQEYALEEAEDIVAYFDLNATPPEQYGGENEAFPCQGNCIQTGDATPIEPGVVEAKYYLPGTGFVLALSFELNDEGQLEWTGEREELVCQGESLAVLQGEACGIKDPEELLETLCDVAGDAFCDD